MRVKVLATGAAAALLVLTGCSGDDDDPTITADPTVVSEQPSASASAEPSATPSAPASPAFDGTVITVTVAGGEVQTAESRVRVGRNEKVRLVVTADVKDHVHLHTYDVLVDTVPGQPATLEFEATIPGTHEVELEESGLRLLEISVG